MIFTTVIPVFNTPAGHLIEAVESVVYQTRNPIIIVDDGSTNKETLLAEDLLFRKYPFIKVYYRSVNGGTSAALNDAQALVETEFIALHGSSDLWLPGKVKAQVDYMTANPETDVLGTGIYAFNDAGNPFRKEFFRFVHPEKPTPGYLKGQAKYFIVNHGTVMYRKSAVDAVGGYQKPGRAQDVDLWERMHKNGATFRNISKVLYLWRR